MKSRFRPLLFLTAGFAIGLGSGTVIFADPVSLLTVEIGDPNNAADTTGFGSVDHSFAIGKFEISVAQYTAFLNAVAAADSYGLYNPLMATDLNIAGISRNGSSGGFAYEVFDIDPNTSGVQGGDRPIAYVSWFDAARFANWMHNGQPTGAQSAETTEEGAYTLLGATSGIGYSKNTDATWWIPSEDEWYKAAYFSPALGETGGYWLFPTQSDTQPNSRNGSPDDANSANYGYDDGLSNGFNGGFAVTDFPDWDPGQNYLTSVGSFFSAGSTYQTFDQGGNLAEWTDGRSGNLRNYRGGSWEDFAESLASGNPLLAYPQDEGAFLGFRLATVSVPEPSAAFLIALVAIGVGFIRKQP